MLSNSVTVDGKEYILILDREETDESERIVALRDDTLTFYGRGVSFLAALEDAIGDLRARREIM